MAHSTYQHYALDWNVVEPLRHADSRICYVVSENVQPQLE